MLGRSETLFYTQAKIAWRDPDQQKEYGSSILESEAPEAMVPGEQSTSLLIYSLLQ